MTLYEHSSFCQPIREKLLQILSFHWLRVESSKSGQTDGTTDGRRIQFGVSTTLALSLHNLSLYLGFVFWFGVSTTQVLSLHNLRPYLGWFLGFVLWVHILGRIFVFWVGLSTTCRHQLFLSTISGCILGCILGCNSCWCFGLYFGLCYHTSSSLSPQSQVVSWIHILGCIFVLYLGLYIGLFLGMYLGLAFWVGISTLPAPFLHNLRLYLGREQQSQIPTPLMAVDVGLAG